jgi:hypothetical protein
MREMTGVASAFKIKLRNVNARFLKPVVPGLARVLEGGKVVYMSSAVQSGSDRILNLMNRGYTAEERFGAGSLPYPGPPIRARLPPAVTVPRKETPAARSARRFCPGRSPEQTPAFVRACLRPSAANPIPCV